jgi:hypothetical protein
MRTPPRIALLAVALLCILAGFSACKKSEPASHGSAPTDAPTQADADTTHGEDGNTTDPDAEAPAATPVLRDANGIELVQFRPELLLSDAYTMDYMVLLPPEDERPLVINMKGANAREGRVRVRVAVECASEAAFEELEGRAEFMERAVQVAFETRTADVCRSLEGKLQIKEDIIREIQERMNRSKGIKQVYFLEFQFL